MKSDDDVRRFFEEEFPDAEPLMPTLLEDFRQNPTGSLVTIRCAPWYYRDKVCLVGDAALDQLLCLHIEVLPHLLGEISIEPAAPEEE